MQMAQIVVPARLVPKKAAVRTRQTQFGIKRVILVVIRTTLVLARMQREVVLMILVPAPILIGRRRAEYPVALRAMVRNLLKTPPAFYFRPEWHPAL